ncbi:MAG: flavin reductase family protein [Thiolinea sp.]
MSSADQAANQTSSVASDQRSLRQALGCFATGVTVVTTRFDGQDYGMTCSSFNAVSLDPALVLWSLQQACGSREAYLNGGGYTVSVLSAKQSALAMHFARGSQEERFAGIGVQRAPSGRILVPDCVAWFDCDLHQIVPAGDHDILLGNVQAYECAQGEGLIFERSRFGTLKTAA